MKGIPWLNPCLLKLLKLTLALTSVISLTKTFFASLVALFILPSISGSSNMCASVRDSLGEVQHLRRSITFSGPSLYLKIRRHNCVRSVI